jgi:hypothetical protein
MKTKLVVYTSICFALAGTLKAQQADSVRVSPSDSAAIRRFMNAQGPAEAVFSLISPPPYKFKSGIYSVARSDFPLRNSPDPLVWQPIVRAYKQKRKARIALISTVVPLGVLAYSAASILATISSVVVGKSTLYRLPERNVIKTAGIASIVGIALTGTFNLASIINSKRGIKRHNKHFGRQYPTIFNPKGL